MRWFHLFLAVLFLSGCTGATITGDHLLDLPADEQLTYASCQEFCEAQPHIMCVGEYNVSGTYPDCNCVYVCTVTQ